ncbi:Rieske 2Fe-2S domain-containing protein [Archangium sp.]|uniref:Rieske 2Fe-2S domain-containing protein n=1 Tax=Archangium sp. TaxID=1872627 RepID=UPI002D6AF3DB|nr:Rieske 2Fe-2S domain-containing protein [Archangium sp.]HYO57087.1 Rieske 2Fe-2S domain-containing protein [Archangium sp.]
MTFTRVCAAEELWEGKMESFTVEGREVLVVHVEGGFQAYEGLCPHQSVPLVEGTLEGCVLTCRTHHWKFDVRTGAGINPARARLRPLPVRVEDGQVQVGEPGEVA